MALTAAQKARKDNLNRQGTLFFLLGAVSLATFGATLGPALFAGLMFSLSISSYAQAANVGRAAAPAGAAPGGGAGSFWGGWFARSLLSPSPRYGRTVHRTHHAVPARAAGPRAAAPRPTAHRTVVFGGPGGGGGGGAATPKPSAAARGPATAVKLRRA